MVVSAIMLLALAIVCQVLREVTAESPVKTDTMATIVVRLVAVFMGSVDALMVSVAVHQALWDLIVMTFVQKDTLDLTVLVNVNATQIKYVMQFMGVFVGRASVDPTALKLTQHQSLVNVVSI